MTKLVDSNWGKKTQKLKFWQISKTKNMTILNSDKTFKSLFIKTTWHLDNRSDLHWTAFCDLAMFLSTFADRPPPCPYPLLLKWLIFLFYSICYFIYFLSCPVKLLKSLFLFVCLSVCRKTFVTNSPI